MNLDLQTNILLQADDFAEAYQRCIQGKNQRNDKEGRLRCSVVNIPAIVNAAFACELYIKSMLDDCKNCHDLKSLYLKLDGNKQMLIRQSVDNNFNKHPVYSFDFCLDRATKVFVDWRYVFEKEHTEAFHGSYINEYLMFFGFFLEALKILAHENMSPK